MDPNHQINRYSKESFVRYFFDNKDLERLENFWYFSLPFAQEGVNVWGTVYYIEYSWIIILESDLAIYAIDIIKKIADLLIFSHN